MVDGDTLYRIALKLKYSFFICRNTGYPSTQDLKYDNKILVRLVQ